MLKIAIAIKNTKHTITTDTVTIKASPRISHYLNFQNNILFINPLSKANIRLKSANKYFSNLTFLMYNMGYSTLYSGSIHSYYISLKKVGLSTYKAFSGRKVETIRRKKKSYALSNLTKLGNLLKTFKLGILSTHTAPNKLTNYNLLSRYSYFIRSLMGLFSGSLPDPKDKDFESSEEVIS